MRKIIQIVLLSAMACLCFAEGSLQLLFETPAERKARKEVMIKRQILETATRDRDWGRFIPYNQLVDFCNPGNARKSADMPVFYGAVAEAFQDSITLLEHESLSNPSQTEREYYEAVLQRYGGPEFRHKRVSFNVSKVFNPSTNAWEEPTTEFTTVNFKLKRGVEIDRATNEIRHRETDIPFWTTYVFTPYGYIKSWGPDFKLPDLSCADGNSIMLVPYEVSFISSLEYYYKVIADLAAQGNFDDVAAMSQIVLEDITYDDNVFRGNSILDMDAVLPLLILSRQYSEILKVDDNFMNYLDDGYFYHEENRRLGMGEVTSLSPYLQEALLSWQKSESEQEALSKESPEVQAYVKVMVAKSLGLFQEKINRIVKEVVPGIDNVSKAFILRHFFSEQERGGIMNMGFSYGKPEPLGDRSSRLLDGDFSFDFLLDLSFDRVVYGLYIGATTYNIKDKSLYEKGGLSEDEDYSLRSLRINFNIGYRPFIFSYMDTYLYGSLIVEENLIADVDSAAGLGFAVGGVFDFFFTERQVVTTFPLEGNHTIEPIEPGTVPVRPAVGFSRPGLRLRVEYSIQKLLDEYRSGLDISLGLVWNFYGYKQVKFE